MWDRCNEDPYWEVTALIKERENSGNDGNIRDGEKWTNSIDMLHVEPVGFADRLNEEEQWEKVCQEWVWKKMKKKKKKEWVWVEHQEWWYAIYREWGEKYFT